MAAACRYKAKFPELASFVHDAVQYARTVQAIGNEMDLTKVDLEGILPQVRNVTHHVSQQPFEGASWSSGLSNSLRRLCGSEPTVRHSCYTMKAVVECFYSMNNPIKYSSNSRTAAAISATDDSRCMPSHAFLIMHVRVG